MTNRNGELLSELSKKYYGVWIVSWKLSTSRFHTTLRAPSPCGCRSCLISFTRDPTSCHRGRGSLGMRPFYKKLLGETSYTSSLPNFQWTCTKKDFSEIMTGELLQSLLKRARDIRCSWSSVPLFAFFFKRAEKNPTRFFLLRCGPGIRMPEESITFLKNS